jgi:hypothetical protein
VTVPVAEAAAPDDVVDVAAVGNEVKPAVRTEATTSADDVAGLVAPVEACSLVHL